MPTDENPNPFDLTPGTYRLARDVANPHPDRRVNQSRLTSWEGWVTWPAGLIFIVEHHGERNAAHLKARGGFEGFFPWDDRYSSLASALEPIAETPSDLIRRLEGSGAGRYALEILDRLLNTNAAAEALIAIHAEEDARDASA